MSLCFRLRQRLAWAGLPFSDHPQDASDAVLSPRARVLVDRYELEKWLPKMSRLTLQEAVGVLDLLDQLPAELFAHLPKTDSRYRLLDIGSKCWRYLPGLVAGTKRFFGDASAHYVGVEIDAFRLFSDWTTGVSRARYFSEVVKSEGRVISFVPQDVQNFRDPASLVTWFFPFIFPSSHARWGLPRKLFVPEKLFAHVEQLLLPGGVLVLANYGRQEWEQAERQLGQTRMRLLWSKAIENPQLETDYPIVLSAWTREA